MTLKKGNWVPPPYPGKKSIKIYTQSRFNKLIPLFILLADLLMKLHVPDVNCFSPQFKASM